jgi:2,5-dichloro-2,5-cyclohexadiene-1,4-diol dehydrogenase 2
MVDAGAVSVAYYANRLTISGRPHFLGADDRNHTQIKTENNIMGNRLEGKVAIITGGASGIGEAHAHLYASEGANVVITDVQEDLGEQVVSAIKSEGGDAIFIRQDVTSESDWANVVQTTLDKYGAITTLVNNAGVGNFTGVEEETLEGFNRVVAICQTGVWLGMRACMPALKKSGNGAIVNISSLFGIIGTPSMIAYHGAKGAVRLMTKSAGLEYAQQGVRVNSVHPGIIETPLAKTMGDEQMQAIIASTPMARVGRPIDIATMSLFLCSDEAAFITGAEFVVDGGWGAQ